MEENPEKLQIYTAKLTFKRKGNEKSLLVQIRFQKRGNDLNKKTLFPENIGDDELSWIKYQGHVVAIYTRHYHVDNNYEYRTFHHQITPTHLAQRLEEIVKEIILEHEARLKED